ncbi:tyrosinase family protein [Flavobacterium succinicans]|uniref:Common central domain of tyrosinase n=1 Tax=Flavobacterium succinicans TaxID=29536 RepID=A0A199XNB6_9FLAO|nr:tyrosinase family protein [Flavobacterium succinicans]OAZ03223.1 common central domain of tyrosinase [Flavobacterium succinicans]
MNSFIGKWVDQQNVLITITGSKTSISVSYSNGRGPFQGTLSSSNPLAITVNFTDDGGNKTGTLSSNNDEIDWDNGTTWKQLVYLRRNAWDANNGGQFVDQSGNYTDLYWYAKAVQVMQSRPISDPTSWWFYAAIHGQLLLPESVYPRPYQYLNWVNISYIGSSANLSTLPSKSLTNLFWDQCQHGTWFFPPWHRGYLVALENILRTIIAELKGPLDWALPYWNYLSQSTAYVESNIPPAFTLTVLPDNTPNPLYVPERYGSSVQVGNDENEANDECQWDTIYSEGAAPSKTGPGDLNGYFYGGGETGFSHSGSETGDLEQNPHNFVHGMVGGQNAAKQIGLMGVPATAGLDPIFFLHHSNIDRMWDAWNVTGNNSNPSDADWLVGPTANGNSQFAMPLDSSGTPWYYTPGDVQSTNNLKYNGSYYSYTYSDLSLTSYDTVKPGSQQDSLSDRLTKLGATNLDTAVKMTNQPNNELVGASSGSITLKNTEAKATVQLDKTAWKSVKNSLLKASVSDVPDEVYLQLEGVKGGGDSNFLSVYVNQTFVKSVSLFGLIGASLKNSSHGGAGLTYKFNITSIIDQLHLENAIDIDALDVQIKSKDTLLDGDEITVERIGIYRSGQ